MTPMQVAHGIIEALQSHAAKIIRNEKQAKIQDKDGVLQPVVDEGGRQCLRSLILDLQSAARGFEDSDLAIVERAVPQTVG